jgi:hypothetical protein
MGLWLNDSRGIAVTLGWETAHTMVLRRDGPAPAAEAFGGPGDPDDGEGGEEGEEGEAEGEAEGEEDDAAPQDAEGDEVQPAPAAAAGEAIDWAVIEKSRGTPVRGTVVMADGKTPALGARVLRFTPDDDEPIADAVADAHGRFITGWRSYAMRQPAPEPPGAPRGAFLLAWLPGACGAVVVPLDEAALVAGGAPGGRAAADRRIVLPPEAALKGRVTVARRRAAAADGTITVRAACVGRGKIDPFLSVDLTPEPDGTFELRGLTPGSTYRVRALLDGARLSEEIEVQVTPERTEPVRLDIPPAPRPHAPKTLVDPPAAPRRF